jgi:hypothetical protein
VSGRSGPSLAFGVFTTTSLVWHWDIKCSESPQTRLLHIHDIIHMFCML